MTDRLGIDPVSLEGIANRARRTGDTPGATSNGTTAAPEAGDDTPIFTELLARHTPDATGRAQGLGLAATQIIRASQTYVTEELDIARNISGGR